MNTSLFRALLVTQLMFSLIACGGSGNKPDQIIEKPTTETIAIININGIAIDGYLSMAKVCIDLNNNYQCDGASEYQTITDSEGKFTLSMPEINVTAGPLLITTSAGITIDSDHPEQTITKPYFLLAPSTLNAIAEPKVISPLTTLIYAKLQAQSDQLSPDQALDAAEKQILSQLKLTSAEQLYGDFIKAAVQSNLTQEQQKANQRTKMQAQVIADVMAKGLEASKNNAAYGKDTQAAKLFLQKFTENSIELVAKKIDNAISLGITEASNIADDIIDNNPQLIVSTIEIEQGFIEQTPAPTNGIVDDNQNTFSWAIVPGFIDINDYEYSLDEGQIWQSVADNFKINIGNIDLGVNKLQVRVKAKNQMQAGKVLSNNSAFYKQHEGAGTPKLIAVNDQLNHDNVQWQFVENFDNINDYEMSLDGANSWQAATTPIIIGDINLGINQIHVRVKAGVHRDVGQSLIISQAFTKYIIPDAAFAPTYIASDDINNTFTFALISDFPHISNYEVKINSELWFNATNNIIQLEDKEYAIGSIKVRVKGDEASLRPAGNTLTNPIAFTVKPLPAEPPTNGVVDDNQNTFSWTPVPNFNSATDYEYSLNAGLTWQDVTGNLVINIGNIDIGINKVHVRVKAKGQRDAGEVLNNSIAFYKQYAAPAAPILIAINDEYNLDNVQWDFTSGFNKISDYEMSLNGNNSWIAATSPIQIGNINLDINQIYIRVKAGVHRDAGEPLIISHAFTKYIIPNAPDAPGLIELDDINNLFIFRINNQFPEISHYETQINQASWETANSQEIQLEEEYYGPGSIKVRVKADETTQRPAGNILSNSVAFTIKALSVNAPTNGVVDDNQNTFSWSPVPGFITANDYEYSLNAGQTWRTVDNNLTINIGNISLAINRLQVRVAENLNPGNNKAGAILSNHIAYTVSTSPVNVAAPTNAIIDDVNNTFTFTLVPDFSSLSDYEYSTNAGINWQQVSTNPISLTNEIYAIGQIQVRVSENLNPGNNKAGAILSNHIAYTVSTSPVNVAAPTNAIIDDVNNTFTFTLVPDFSSLSDYEYSTNAGINWQQVSTNPISLTNEIYAIAQIQVRVAENLNPGNNKAGAILSNHIAYTASAAPINVAAPTNAIIDDVNNTFAFTLVPDFSSLSDYEYSTNAGINWQQVSTNPISLTNEIYAIGQIQVRVSENLNPGNNKAGAILSNQIAYTTNLATGPIAPVITYLRKNNGISWKMLTDYTELKHYEYTNDKGLTWYPTISNPQHIGHLAYSKEEVGIRVKAQEKEEAIAAGSVAWASSHEDENYQFEFYPYTWLNKNHQTEALNTNASWDKTETSCMLDHNQAIPSFWIKIDSTTANKLDEKMNALLAKKPCGTLDWSLIPLNELISKSQAGIKSELADFSHTYNQFITKSDAGETVFVQNGAQLSSYSDGTALLQWQYPGVTSTLNTITAIVTKIQTQVTNDEPKYKNARTPADNLLTDYQNAKSINNYLLINDNLTSSKTVLETSLELIKQHQLIIEKDFEFAQVLANFVTHDPLADEIQKQNSTDAISTITTAVTIQNERITELAALIVQIESLAQVLANVEAIHTAQTELNALTTSLTHFATSYPALLTALNSAQTGSEQHKQAKLLLNEWHQLMDKYQTAIDKLNQYQVLLDALPSNLHADALAELLLVRNTLNTAKTHFNLNDLTTDYQTVKQAFEDAYQSGYQITIDNAVIGTHFAKLDIAGHYIEADTTFYQGWRCLTDLRYQERQRVWALLNKGTLGSIDNVAYSGGSDKNLMEAGGLLAQYNSDAICNYTDWQIPTIHLLGSLATTNISKEKLSIDPAVFPNHQGTNLDSYYYWSVQAPNSTQHRAYQYNSPVKTSFSNEQDLANIGEDNYFTFARVYRQQKQQLLDSTGNVTTDWDTATCVKESSGAIWHLPKTGEINTRYQTIAKLTGIAENGGIETDNIPHLMNTASAPLCGKTNWQLPTLAQLSDLYFYPLNKTYFQYWHTDSTENNDHNFYLSRDIKSSSSYRCLALNGDAADCNRKAYNGALINRYLYIMISEPTKDVPDAPINGVVNDGIELNTFGWDYATGFNQNNQYEYSINAGLSWKEVTDNPQNINDNDLAEGDVQVRVKGRAEIFLPTGKALKSTKAFTPSIACSGYFNNGFCYNLVADEKSHIDALTHCTELGSGLLTKETDTDLFSVITNGLSLDNSKNYWLNETRNEDAYTFHYSNDKWKVDNFPEDRNKTYPFVCIKLKAVADAPSNGTVVDTTDINTFGWDYVSGYITPIDYEYSINTGKNWIDVTTNPQSLSDINLEIGDVQVRVKAKPQEYLPAGEILKSTQKFSSLKNCTGYFENGNCYTLATPPKNHTDASNHCLAEGAGMVSKDATVDFTQIANYLSLESKNKYWLKEIDSWGYGYSLRDSSGWGADYASINISTSQPFICVK